MLDYVLLKRGNFNFLRDFSKTSGRKLSKLFEQGQWQWLWGLQGFFSHLPPSYYCSFEEFEGTVYHLVHITVRPKNR